MRVWFPVVRVQTGAEVFVQNLAQAMQRPGFSATVSRFPFAAEICPVALGCITLPPDTDIIHVNCDYGFPFMGRGVPVVATLFHWVHDPVFAPYRGPLQALYHRLLLRRYQERSLRAAAAVTTISEYSARQLRAALPDMNPRVIYPGVDTDFFTPGPVRAGDGVFRLLFVGTPSRRKGFDLLAPIARALGAGFELHHAGGPAIPGIANLKHIGRLTRPRLLAAYRDCDALLLPTRYEGFGLVAAEAMACGKPVIASRCTSLPELVEDGGTGILCPVDDVAAFVAAARRLAAEPGTCGTMGRAGRERVVAQFGLAPMAREYAALYASLCGN